MRKPPTFSVKIGVVLNRKGMEYRLRVTGRVAALHAAKGTEDNAGGGIMRQNRK